MPITEQFSDRPRILVLRGSRTARRQQRLARRVGDQVKVKEALRLVQLSRSGLSSIVHNRRV